MTLFKKLAVIAEGFVMKSNVHQFILVMTLYSFLLHAFALPLLYFVNRFNPHRSFLDDLSVIEIFVIVVIIAPVLETLIFQLGIIESFKKITQNNFLLVAVSAFSFAIVHLSSLVYAFSNLLTGIVFAQTYLLADQKKLSSYWCTSAVHASRNCVVFLIGHIF